MKFLSVHFFSSLSRSLWMEALPSSLSTRPSNLVLAANCIPQIIILFFFFTQNLIDSKVINV